MTKKIAYNRKYIVTGLSLLIGLCLWCTSCSKDSEKETPVSRFASNVSTETYPQTAPPSTAPEFRWDFSKSGTVYTYTYEQNVNSQSSLGAVNNVESDNTSQEMTAEGMLLIKSQGDKTADLVLKDIKATMKMGTEKDGYRTMTQKIPDFVMQGMQEDGSGFTANSSQDMLMKMLFPLPPKTLKLGESIEVPKQVPFSVMGSVLQVKGHSRITLTRYVKIGNRTCAQFNVDTDISELNVPSELKGEYAFLTRGTSTFYFDVTEHIFVSGTIAIIMRYSIEASMPHEKDISGISKKQRISMDSDNLIQVRLRE